MEYHSRGSRYHRLFPYGTVDCTRCTLDESAIFFFDFLKKCDEQVTPDSCWLLRRPLWNLSKKTGSFANVRPSSSRKLSSQNVNTRGVVL